MTYSYYSFELVLRLEETRLLRYKHCSSHFHMNVQISFVLLLQCFCFASAYRGKNLPAIFNESMSLIYASLMTTFGFAVMFPIQYFQKDPFTRSTTSWMLITMNNILFLLFCYGGKMHFIIFKRHKNNASYFQQKTFMEFRKLEKNEINQTL